MLISLTPQDIANFVAEYERYRAQQEHDGIEELRFYNGELEVDQYLSENLHLVWYGHFHKRFPPYWTLVPDMPPSEENTLFLKEKAKVRYICQECCHTWTSQNGSVKFWAAGGHQVFFYLPGADCSHCNAPEQPALWYPDEVVRVLENLFGFLNAGKAGRDEMESRVRYRRGVTRGVPSSGSSTVSPSERRESLCMTPRRLSESLENANCSGSSDARSLIPLLTENNMASSPRPRAVSNSSHDSGVGFDPFAFIFPPTSFQKHPFGA